MTAVNATDASDVLSQYQLKQQNGGQGTSELGRNEFMELMLAQLKNQNPLEPQDNGAFISQLAQFSSLEEMQNLSGTVEDVVGQFRSTQALQASAMVGKTVLAAHQSRYHAPKRHLSDPIVKKGGRRGPSCIKKVDVAARSV